MKCLFCCEFYYPSVGGVQMVMQQIAERLVEKGHEVTVATTKLAEREERSINGVEIVEFNVTGNLAKGLDGEVQEYQSFLKNFDADVLLIKAAQQWTFDAACGVLDEIRMKTVFIPCGFSGLRRGLYQKYYEEMPNILKKIDHLIFYSSDYQDIDFARKEGLENYSVVPNGASESEFGRYPADNDIREKLDISPEAFVFLTVGARNGQKGHAEVAEAFSRMQNTTEAQITLILNGNIVTKKKNERKKGLMRKLRRSVKILLNLLLPNKIVLRNQEDRIFVSKIRCKLRRKFQLIETDLKRRDLVKLLFTSNLFVFASKTEYSPLVLFESAAAGTPILTVPVGNAEEILSWTKGGYLCPCEKDEVGNTNVDSAILAEHMTYALSHQHEMCQMGVMGREAWAKEFTWETITERYEAILQATLNSEAA
ncbi:glycosyltransferase family 4 protein [Roseibium salinum]|uniref:Glycosyltransferase family 4 protein n=1 Tax=Roseibium salinum TaxID=1604349 RepID=A0ABT3R5W7_9HYPH|nr:glycosyltransferase family 4 protein [Roseibium sp. DSM 29163]MCX2724544.1 glycosyltransferase family 4 protein [Roseibium sp. DSM 29163]